jgi:hypothetical protein
MKLSDVVGAAGLAGYAEVALVLFLIAFAAIVTQVVSRKRAAEWTRAASLPLGEDETQFEARALHTRDETP